MPASGDESVFHKSYPMYSSMSYVRSLQHVNQHSTEAGNTATHKRISPAWQRPAAWLSECEFEAVKEEAELRTRQRSDSESAFILTIQNAMWCCCVIAAAPTSTVPVPVPCTPSMHILVLCADFVKCLVLPLRRTLCLC